MKINVITLIVLAILQPVAYASTNKIVIDVVKIIDGDTMKVKLENNTFSVRLVGIDCFESAEVNNYRAYKQAYENKIEITNVIQHGIRSTNYVKDLYKNSKKQYLEFKGLDKYKRVLGVIYFDDLNVNEELLKKNICPSYIYKE